MSTVRCPGCGRTQPANKHLFRVSEPERSTAPQGGGAPIDSTDNELLNSVGHPDHEYWFRKTSGREAA